MLAIAKSLDIDLQQQGSAPIDCLPDEVLYWILHVTHALHNQWRRNALVCRKWYDVLHKQGRPLQSVFINFQMEEFVQTVSLAAVGRWLQLQQSRGSIKFPLALTCNNSDAVNDGKGFSTEGFCAILGTLGPALHRLDMWHTNNMLSSATLRCLWTTPNLRVLCLTAVHFPIDLEDINEGLRHCQHMESFMLISKEDGDQYTDWGLPAFPEVLCSLPTLHYLYLGDQLLQRIPDALSGLTSLRDLILCSSCRWSLAPGQPLLLPPGLTNLHLACARWPPPDADAVAEPAPVADTINWGQLTSLQCLTVTGGSFSFANTGPLPSGVTNLTNLVSLTIFSCDAICLHTRLSRLVCLRVLELNGCELRQLPAFVPQLPCLVDLYLMGCVLSAEDASWTGGFPALNACKILSPKLTRVSESLCAMTGITSLNLYESGVAAISPAISRLVRLQKLDLAYNFLAEVPQELSCLTTLTKLHLHRNTAGREAALSAVPNEHGQLMLPKMRVTEASLRFLLRWPALRLVYLDVTLEERAALAGFREDMRRVRRGRNVLRMKVSQPFFWV